MKVYVPTPGIIYGKHVKRRRKLGFKIFVLLVAYTLHTKQMWDWRNHTIVPCFKIVVKPTTGEVGTSTVVTVNKYIYIYIIKISHNCLPCYPCIIHQIMKNKKYIYICNVFQMKNCIKNPTMKKSIFFDSSLDDQF